MSQDRCKIIYDVFFILKLSKIASLLSRLQVFLLILFTFTLTSCYRLDDFLFNPDDSIEAYLFDDYENPEIEIPDSYNIPEDLIHLFKLNDEGNDIYAVYVGDLENIATDTVILYCHGNAKHMDHYWTRTKLLANVGHKNRYGVLTLDYSGYGLSEGKPSEEGLYRQVDLAMQWLKDRGMEGSRLVIYGYSMGSAPSTKLSAEPRSLRPEKLILEAPFASAEVMVQDASVLAMPGSFFVNLQINNAELIKKVEQDFLWLHGTVDLFLNMNTHGEVVYKNHSGNYKKALRVNNGTHNDLPIKLNLESYLDELEKFIVH
jgi:fermentation-respiration switch protein FrsA (DUF1100 family)